MYVYAQQILTPQVFRLCRLLKLENQFNVIMAEMGTVKQRAFGLEGWKQQVDDASTQVASVLGHLNTGVEDIRYNLLVSLAILMHVLLLLMMLYACSVQLSGKRVNMTLLAEVEIGRLPSHST